MGFLTPDLCGTTLSVSTVVAQPTRITERIAALAADQIVLDKIFSTLGQRLTGGAMLFNVVKTEEFFAANDVEERSPGSEYPVIRRVEPTAQLALVQDWGGKFEIDDIKISRTLPRT
jgi:hypothetical protein